MRDAPAVRYVRSGDVNIAYCRWGEGPETVVFTPALVTNVELFWELPEWRRVLEHAGANHDTVMLDKRGVGLSDRTSHPPTLADRVADTLAVLDAEGLGRVHLVGQSEGGEIAMGIAAEHPQRVRSLLLVGSPAAGVASEVLADLADPDNPLPDPAQQAETFRSLVRHWGSEASINLEVFAPSVAGDPRIRRWYQRFERQSASAGAVLGFLRSMKDFDVRPFLDVIDVPTLVIHGRGDRVVHVANGRYLSEAIRGARYLEYPNDDHLLQLSADWRSVQDEMIRFVTGRPAHAAVQSQIATVVSTDLVASTARGAAVGDRAWRHLLDVHDRLNDEIVTAVGGRVVKHTGDGMLALFADPADAVVAAKRLSAELGALGLPIRTGVHTGRVEIRDGGDVSGITVNLACRVQAEAEAGEVLISRTVRDLLLGTEHGFETCGDHELKGIPDTWELYRAVT